jgi:hypothetical protein
MVEKSTIQPTVAIATGMSTVGTLITASLVGPSPVAELPRMRRDRRPIRLRKTTEYSMMPVSGVSPARSLHSSTYNIPIKEIRKLISPASTNAVVSSELKMMADLDRVSV